MSSCPSRQFLTIALGLALLVGGLETATAARFHVLVGGERADGASAAADWSAPNCYPTLAAAAAVAGPADTLLVSRELHAVTTVVYLSAMLGNAELDAEPGDATLSLIDGGTLVVAAGGPDVEVRGIDIRGDGSFREVTGLLLLTESSPGRTITIHGCRFSDLYGGVQGGGGAIRALAGAPRELNITSSLFERNQTLNRGGAIRIDDGHTVLIEDCTFRENRAVSDPERSNYGGAIHIDSPQVPTQMTIRRCDFADNEAGEVGGALCIFDGGLVLEETRVSGSRSAYTGQESWCAGAGLMMRRSEDTHTEPIALEVRYCEFSDNVGNLASGVGAGDGGAILVRGRLERLIDVTVENTDFFDNYNAQGAGLYIGRFTNGTVSHCRFHRNRTFTSGGATFKGGALLENLGETVVYSYCEFIDNVAGETDAGAEAWSWARGGAFSTRERPRAEFRHCTFVNNVVRGNYRHGDAISLVDEGNAFDDDLERCVLINCVFWGTDGNDVQVRADADGFSEVSHCAWAADEFAASGVAPEATVLLSEVPFASLTEPVPAPGSPLIDAGLDLGLAVDLAGVSVPQGSAPDIGAYEFPSGISATLPSLDDALRLQAHPNPFNPTTQLTCELAAPTHVTVVIVDLRGRRVASLQDGHLSAGTHRWLWDGRDHSGQHVAGGSYLALMQADGGIAHRKLMLVK